MLSPSELDQYTTNGFVVPDFRMSDDAIKEIKRCHAHLVERYPQFVDYCPSLLTYDIGFLDFARNSDLLDMVEQIIGPNIVLWNSSFFAKPAGVGSRTPWHQDGEYWPIRPLATCSVWIAVDDSTRENGCLQVIPASHAKQSLAAHHVNKADGLALPLELDQDSFNETEAIDIELEAGQISLHDVYLMHASDPNRSNKPRRGMTLRFMPTTSVYRRDLEGVGGRIDQERSLFLMRGEDISGENDFRLRPVMGSIN